MVCGGGAEEVGGGCFCFGDKYVREALLVSITTDSQLSFISKAGMANPKQCIISYIVEG